jgi:DNA-binding NtrC family response regulator
LPHALVVDDDLASLNALASLVEQEGFTTTTADNLEKARLALLQRMPDVVLCDLMLPDGRGTELLRELSEEPGTEVILITGRASVETAVEALRLGAHDYLIKPVDPARLVALLSTVRRTQDLKQEVSALRGELRQLGRFGDLVGASPRMQKVYDLIERVSRTEATVMLVGESGTGKDVVAETIHRLGGRRDQTFLPVNCGAISPNLMESELFGHEKGSFTGANRQHQGYFERADGGSLFLDEIIEMPIEMQAKFLRVLETGDILRVGGTRPQKVDVRILAATNRDPRAAVEGGKLREDLYYRLQVFPIELPPLRYRTGDVELLGIHFLNRLNQREQEHGGEKKRLSDAALHRLDGHTWPGNVRELKHVLERAFILADDEILPEHLTLEGPIGELPGSGPRMHVRIGSSIAEVERRLILASLEHLGGDKKQVAEVLGVSLKTLYNRLNSYQASERD